jgi:tyrosine-protein kinase Etk/Wzc
MKIDTSSSNDVGYKNENISLSFKEIVLKYLRYLPLFIISLFIAGLISYMYLRYTTPRYRVVGTLLIKNENSNSANEKFNELFLFKSTGKIDDQIEVLRSKTLMQRVVKKLGLENTTYAIGKIKTSNVYQGAPAKVRLLSIRDSARGLSFNIKLVDEQRFNLNGKLYSFNSKIETGDANFFIELTGIPFPKDIKEYIFNWVPANKIAESYVGGLTVKPVSYGANVLQLSYNTDNVRLGKDILNQLMEEYNQANIEDKNTIAAKTKIFIDDRLRIITEELDQVERSLQGFKEKYQVVDIAKQSEVFLDNMKDVESQFQEQSMRSGVVKIMEDYLGSSSNKYSRVSSSFGIDDPVFARLANEFNQAQLEREQQISLTTPDNPIVKQIELQIEKIRLGLLEQLGNIKKSYEITKTNIIRKNNDYQAKINSLPAKEKQLLDISRQQVIKASLYEFLLTKREETAITLASTISNSKIIDPASSSSIPTTPNSGSTYMLAIILGLLLPVVFIYIKELLNDKILTKSDIQSVTDAPILGEVGHIDVIDNFKIISNNDRSYIAEQFRAVRTNLQYFTNKNDVPVLLVTSTFSGEGKSFVTINLGAVFALAGKRTLVMEFDIRKPKIIKNLNIQNSNGITNYLVGNVNIESLVIQAKNFDNLYVLPCGPIPPNPAEILLDKKIETLFDWAKKSFDIVIIDTAPVGLVTDSIVLNKFSNASLYIVRQRYTHKRDLQFINDIYVNKKLNNISILVNDVKAEGTGYYGYGNYTYGYGYGSQHDEKSIWKRILQRLNFFN